MFVDVSYVHVNVGPVAIGQVLLLLVAVLLFLKTKQTNFM